MIVLYISGMQMDSFILDMATIGCVLMFLISMGAPAFLLAHKMKNIDNKVKRLITESNCDKAFDFLKACAQKKHSDIVNQLLLYYLGYIELLRDNVDCAVQYLKQVKTKKYSLYTLNCAAQAVALLYIALKLTNSDEFNEIRQLFNSEKDKFINKISKNKNPGVAKFLGYTKQSDI